MEERADDIKNLIQQKIHKMRQQNAENDAASVERGFAYQRAMEGAVLEGRKKSDRMAALEDEIKKERMRWRTREQ